MPRIRHRTHPLIAFTLLYASAAAGALTTQIKPPTFYKNVLPVLQRHCQACHRPGEAGPMPLLDYAEVKPWTGAIRQAVNSRQMPPWFADPSVGRFANDRSLSTADIRTITDWVG